MKENRKVTLQVSEKEYFELMVTRKMNSKMVNYAYSLVILSMLAMIIMTASEEIMVIGTNIMLVVFIVSLGYLAWTFLKACRTAKRQVRRSRQEPV